MLEEVKKCFKTAANAIEGWESLNKNTLANLYIDNEDNERLRDAYFGALMCKYWNAIGKYYYTSRNSVTIEECYDWLIHALTYALKNRKWRDPNSNLYGDPTGPDKIINRCIASTRQIFYQASNTDKRRGNFQCFSIDKQKEEFGDSCTSLIDNIPEVSISQSPCFDIITDYIRNDMLLEALIIDRICFFDCLKSEKNLDGTTTSEFNPRKLVKHLNHLDVYDLQYFMRRYSVPETKVIKTFQYIKDISNTNLYKLIRKTLYNLRNNREAIECLCSATY